MSLSSVSTTVPTDPGLATRGSVTCRPTTGCAEGVCCSTLGDAGGGPWLVAIHEQFSIGVPSGEGTVITLSQDLRPLQRGQRRAEALLHSVQWCESRTSVMPRNIGVKTVGFNSLRVPRAGVFDSECPLFSHSHAALPPYTIPNPAQRSPRFNAAVYRMSTDAMHRTNANGDDEKTGFTIWDISKALHGIDTRLLRKRPNA
jgi:hypothetical protein